MYARKIFMDIKLEVTGTNGNPRTFINVEFKAVEHPWPLCSMHTYNDVIPIYSDIAHKITIEKAFLWGEMNHRKNRSQINMLTWSIKIHRYT